MTLMLLTGLVLVGVSAALVVRAAVLPRLRVVARVETITSYGAAATSSITTPSSPTDHPVVRAATRVGAVVLKRAGRRIDREATRKMVLAAGFYRTAPETFIGYQALAAGAGAAFALLTANISLMGVLTIVALPLGGWTVPRFVVQRKARSRSERIEDDLPDLIDLLVVTVEAGLSLSASLAAASRRIEGPLGDELRLAMQEQRMGLPVSDVLHHMLDRADNPSMRSFVRSLVQGETLGVSIGTILRNLADEMRKRRRARAEERAGKAPIKMLFPLIFLIFPALFIVLLAPAMMTIVETMSGLR
jgi:tight adherence protein C